MIPVLLLLACAPDDVTDGVLGDTGNIDSGVHDIGGDSAGDTGAGAQSIVGDWLSQGADLAPLLSADPFNYVSIAAAFGADGSYNVQSTDASGQSGTLRGTFAVDTSTVPGSITLSQSAPYTATASGIWQVDGSKLTYEVVQTDPDYGFTPPTPATGFGSTAGDGLNPGDNVQIYRRQ